MSKDPCKKVVAIKKKVIQDRYTTYKAIKGKRERIGINRSDQWLTINETELYNKNEGFYNVKLEHPDFVDLLP